MNDDYFSYDFKIIYPDNHHMMQDIKLFLSKNNLDIDLYIEAFVIVSNKNKIIGCGGLCKGIIECLAIAPEYRGNTLSLSIITQLLHLANEFNYTNLFVYTSLKNSKFLIDCGFHVIANADNKFVLMENNPFSLKDYCNSLRKKINPGEIIGSIVMNANPFTLGHEYLIQKASEQCDWLHVFLVQENLSLFNYADRFQLVKNNIAKSQLSNITLHSGSKYIISKATFPTYFLKDKEIINNYYTEIDLSLFRNYIAPALRINHRFVGTEPFCKVTLGYNNNMRKILESKSSKYIGPPINVVTIDRKSYKDQVISASKVRELLKEGDLLEIRKYVPSVTLDLIKRKYLNNFNSKN